MSINLLGIIRMGRQGIEKVGVEGLMNGVQGDEKAENLEKRGAERKWRKSQKPHTPNPRMERPDLAEPRRTGHPPASSRFL
jgi:hypothetical protein